MVISLISISLQNTESDYIPAQLISDGLDAQGKMAMGSKDNNYAIHKNNKWYAGNKVTIKKIKVAQCI